MCSRAACRFGVATRPDWLNAMALFEIFLWLRSSDRLKFCPFCLFVHGLGKMSIVCGVTMMESGRAWHAITCSLSVLLLTLLQLGCQRSSVPQTARRPVTNEYHGTKVVDDYLWLEKTDDPAVRKRSAGQNERARTLLDKIPARAMIESRLQQLFEAASARYYGLYARSSHVFALKFKPPKQQAFVVELTSLNDLKSERVVFDPNELNTNGTTAIDWYVPSHNGRLLAVCLSENGSEQGTLHIYDVETGKKLPDELPRVQFPTGGGSAAWNGDDSGIFYTRYPQPNAKLEGVSAPLSPDDLNFYQRIYFHKLGASTDKDTYELGRDFPRIAEITLESREDGRFILATVANGDGGEYAHYLRRPDGQWKQITRFEDQVKQIEFGR